MTSAPADRPVTITADLVAGVLQIDVVEGERVAEGHVLMVLESMKMEIPVLAPAAGVVVLIGVTVGDIVQEGDVLVEIRR